MEFSSHSRNPFSPEKPEKDRSLRGVCCLFGFDGILSCRRRGFGAGNPGNVLRNYLVITIRFIVA